LVITDRQRDVEGVVGRSARSAGPFEERREDAHALERLVHERADAASELSPFEPHVRSSQRKEGGEAARGGGRAPLRFVLPAPTTAGPRGAVELQLFRKSGISRSSSSEKSAESAEAGRKMTSSSSSSRAVRATAGSSTAGMSGSSGSTSSRRVMRPSEIWGS